MRLPHSWPQFQEFFNFEVKPSLRIFTPEGKEVPYQLLQVMPHTAHTVVNLHKMPRGEDRMGVRLALDTKLESAEARHFIIRPAEGPTRISFENSIGIAPNRLRNGFLDVVAESNGTLTLTDLASGRVYRDQLVLEDSADIGDGWFHGIALQDRSYLSTGGKVTFGLMENGPLLARLHIRVEWDVPQEFDFDRKVRSEKLIPLVAEHLVTLRKGSRYAEIQTTIHNTVRDHRVRLSCSSGYTQAKTFWADSAFDAVERPIALNADRHLLRELQVEMTPQQNWVAVGHGNSGLALLAPGQYESGVLDQSDRPLCVTLLRGFRKAVFTDGNDGGQILGSHRFVLGLAPFATSRTQPMPAALLSHYAQNLATPVRSHYLDFADLASMPAPRSSTHTHPSIEGDVVLSASYSLTPGERLIRFYNPNDRATNVRLIGGKDWREVDLEGNVLRKISTRTLKVSARKIVTLSAKT